MSVEKLVEHFSALEDPRCAGKVEHRLIDILVIAVCAVIARQRVARRKKRQRSPRSPAVDHATRTEFGHPRLSIRLRTWAAMAVTRASRCGNAARHR